MAGKAEGGQSRGLASILLTTIVVSIQHDIPHSEIILNGPSSIPMVVWYGKCVEMLHPEAPENKPDGRIFYRNLTGGSLLGRHGERFPLTQLIVQMTIMGSFG